MAQNRDAVLLMTGKTSLIEETQQRYIDALEKRISCLESQARYAKQVYHTTAICKPIVANCTLQTKPQDIADSTVRPEATSPSVAPDIEVPPNTSVGPLSSHKY
jgi:hypothetical protein